MACAVSNEANQHGGPILNHRGVDGFRDALIGAAVDDAYLPFALLGLIAELEGLLKLSSDRAVALVLKRQQ